jgi:hypothetical protein
MKDQQLIQGIELRADLATSSDVYPSNLDLMHGFAQDCWSAYIFFNQTHYFMVKINTFFAEWWSGPTSRGMPNTAYETIHFQTESQPDVSSTFS